MPFENEISVPERRKHARLHKDFVVRRVELRPRDAPRGEGTPDSTTKGGRGPDKITGTNISLGGIAIETEEDYVAGSLLELEIVMPELERYLPPLQRHGSSDERKLFRVQCQVVWSRPVPPGKFTVGLCFVNLDEGQFKALSQLLSDQSRV